MNILITGGSGFIGSNLSKYHLDRNDNVTIIDNLITGNKKNIESFRNNPLLNFIQADLIACDFKNLKKFDIIYHLASPASPIKYQKYAIETLMINSLGTKKLLDFLKENSNASFVLASTSEVYGDPQIHPQVETYYGNVNSVGKRACYDEAKRFAEAISMVYFNKFGLDVRIARIFNTYGPNMEKEDGRVISNFIMQALTGKPLTIYGKGEQTRSFCYIDDMVKGLYLLATTNNKGTVINLGNPDEIQIKELAQIIIDLTGSKSENRYEEIDCDDPKKRKPDISKATKLLGWNPLISLDEGLKKTIKFFKENYA